jgi:uncharacterized protein (TIGR00369 family)
VAVTVSETIKEPVLHRVRKEWEASRMWEWWGIRVESAEPGRCRIAMEVRPEMINRDDKTLHGGVIATLIDTSIGVALCTLYEVGVEIKGHTTTDLNVSYLEGVLTREVAVEAKVLRKGRTLVVGEASVLDGDGKLCASGRATYMVFR